MENEHEVKLETKGPEFQTESKPALKKEIEHEEKAQSEDDKEETKPPIDLTMNQNSPKCKSVTKKSIRLPKHAQQNQKSVLNNTVQASDGVQNSKFGNLYRAYGKRSGKLRTMKSMSPRKAMQRSNFGISDGMSNASFGMQTDMNFRKKNRRRNIRAGYRSLMALNRAGPGSYNLPSLLGGNIMEYGRKNNPRYSIGKADKYSIKSLDKAQRKASTGLDSPGVGRYSPDSEKVRESSPKARIGREKRFIELKN